MHIIACKGQYNYYQFAVLYYSGITCILDKAVRIYRFGNKSMWTNYNKCKLFL